MQKNYNKGYKRRRYFFTDETTIDLSPFAYDSIRMTLEDQEILRKGDPEMTNLINKEEKNLNKK